LKRPQCHALRLRLARREQSVDAVDRKDQCADHGALHEDATLDGIHGHSPLRGRRAMIIGF